MDFKSPPNSTEVAFRELSCTGTMSQFSNAASRTVGAGVRGLVWFKPNDLRVQDHVPLFQAHSTCATVDHVFVFDPRHYRTTKLGLSKCGPRRFSWLCECLVDLSQSLTSQGSTLSLYLGRPETVLPRVMGALGTTDLFTHSEVAWEEQTVQQSVRSSLAADHLKFVESWRRHFVRLEHPPL